MIIYYDRPPVRITSAEIRVGRECYPLAELSQVWPQRVERSWRVLAGRGALITMIFGPLVAALAGLLLAISLGVSLTATAIAVVASCLVGLAAGPVADLLLNRLDNSYLRGAYRLELWARWRGQPVRLISSRDALRFGQIYRALARALEGRKGSDHAAY